jgi:septal ring factor EnvC (AmiA/AmiB activator)
MNTEKPQTNPNSNPNQNGNKIFIYITGAILLIGTLLITSTLFAPKAPQGPPQSQTISQKEIDTTRLEIDALKNQIKTINTNITKIYSNQQNLQTSLEATITSLENLQAESEETRKVLAKMYQRIRDIELQMETIGGGFNMRRPKASIPADRFPETP